MKLKKSKKVGTLVMNSFEAEGASFSFFLTNLKDYTVELYDRKGTVTVEIEQKKVTNVIGMLGVSQLEESDRTLKGGTNDSKRDTKASS